MKVKGYIKETKITEDGIEMIIKVNEILNCHHYLDLQGKGVEVITQSHGKVTK